MPVRQSDATYFYYLPWAMMHEFGHAAGLADLAYYEGDYAGYMMMYGTKASTAIPDKDIAYMRQVYRYHDDDPQPGSP